MTEPTTYSPEQSFARDVLAVAINGGISQWARVHGCRLDCPPEEVLAEGVDTRDGRSLWHLELPDVVAAITKLIEHPADCFCPLRGVDPIYSDGIPTLLRAIRRKLLANDYPLPAFYVDRIDDVMADIVVQVAVAGQVIYR